MHTLTLSGFAPIGVFDSGLGGLSVVEAIRRKLPAESIVYIADSRYAPYGEKGDEFIRARSKALADWLVNKGAKLLVVACNTATTHSIEYLRAQLPIPIIGVEPGIKPAIRTSTSGIVGVLATAATLRSQRLQTLLSEYGATCRFVCQAGHGLVELIEKGETAGVVVEALLERYLTPMIKQGADMLVLGSTHYALLMPSIGRLFGSQLCLIETAGAIARRVEYQLATYGLNCDASTAKTVLQLCSTALAEESRRPLARLAHALSLTGHQIAAINVSQNR